MAGQARLIKLHLGLGDHFGSTLRWCVLFSKVQFQLLSLIAGLLTLDQCLIIQNTLIKLYHHQLSSNLLLSCPFLCSTHHLLIYLPSLSFPHHSSFSLSILLIYLIHFLIAFPFLFNLPPFSPIAFLPFSLF